MILGTVAKFLSSSYYRNNLVCSTRIKMTKYLVFSLLLAVILVSFSSAQVGHEDFEEYDLTWTITGDKIRFRARVKTGGWVGIGLNTKRGMEGAELMISGVTKANDITTPTTPTTTQATTTPTTTQEASTPTTTQESTTPTTTQATTTTSPTTTQESTTPTTTPESSTTSSSSSSAIHILQGGDQAYDYRYVGIVNDIGGVYPGNAWRFLTGTEQLEREDDADDPLETFTTVEWERDLTTSDQSDIQITRGQPIYLMMAYGVNDVINYHQPQHRETEIVDLFNPNAAGRVNFNIIYSLTSVVTLLWIMA